jgi:hypothetical protein
MKITGITHTERKFGLITAAWLLLGGLGAGAANITIIDETFDPPFLVPLGDWGAGGVEGVSRDYVDTGVDGSMAVQLAGEFTPAEGHWFNTEIYQSGGVGGNELATPANTVLSFDIKVDRADMLGVYIYLQGWKGVNWNAFDPTLSETLSMGLVPLGPYTPGMFKHLVIPLNDPLWEQDSFSDPGNLWPLFDPSSKTWQIAVGLGDGTFTTMADPFTVTIDNLQLTTQSAMSPWTGTETGDIRWLDPEQWIPTGSAGEGSADHLGKYQVTVTFPQLPFAILGPAEITAANGDKLFGFMCGGVVSPLAVPIQGEWSIMIQGGTGRFNNATGSLNGRAAFTDATLTHYTAKILGGLSTPGSNKK